MIYPNTIIHWLDIHDSTSRETYIEAMFQQYSHLTVSENNSLVIRFDDRLNVKIKDWYNWTQAISITKYMRNSLDITWRHIKIANHDLCITGDTMIPFYSNVNTDKYTCNVKRYDDKIANVDHFRVRDGVTSDGNDITFVCNEEKLGLMEGDYYYRLVTRSGSFNANNILMWSGENI